MYFFPFAITHQSLPFEAVALLRFSTLEMVSVSKVDVVGTFED